MTEQTELRIIHCFRSPVGGIFRQVRDLVEIQHSRGHKVGILCDSSTGGAFEDRLFDGLRPSLALGLHRIPMKRTIAPSDIITLMRTYKKLRQLQPNVLHSHGAKGGAYARVMGSLLQLTGGKRIARLYCPHGGSMHYDASSLKGKMFFFLERLLQRMTDRLVFVSCYERDAYLQKVGKPRCPVSLVYNGLRPEEFEPVKIKHDAAEFLYIGMMRDLKGPDLFLDAFAGLAKNSPKELRAHMVGDGADKDKYIAQAFTLGVSDQVTFHDAMPARQAFCMAQIVVVPSRAESMPYIVLEAIGGHVPIVATNVGGIPEIMADEIDLLVEPANAQALSQAMANCLAEPDRVGLAAKRAAKLENRFSVEKMADDLENAYTDILRHQ